MPIQRRHLMSSLAWATAGAAMPRAVGRAGAQRPNVVFIMADDLGFADLSCTGSRHIRTPHIDRLAREGMMFTDGYANSAICSPTRTALLTGCYQYRYDIGLDEPLNTRADVLALPRGIATLPSVLRANGYDTALIGKWHLGHVRGSVPQMHGYNRFFGILGGAADYFHHGAIRNGIASQSRLMDQADRVEMNGYLTDIFGDKAVDVVRNSDPAQPFFLSLHFTAPHWPWEGPEDRAIADMLTDFTHHDGGNLDTYKRMVEAMDANIGKLLAALEAKGIADDTLIVFTSDNGGERFSDTWPFTGVKGELLEGGIRVPVIARLPGRIAPGSRSSQPIVSMDFLPTLLGLIGQNPAAYGTFDGLDLSLQLGGAPAVSRMLYWRFKANDQAALRHDNWKYLALGGKEHLFDLAADQRERADLIHAMPERAAAMRRQWADWNATMKPYPADSASGQVKNSYPDRY